MPRRGNDTALRLGGGGDLAIPALEQIPHGRLDAGPARLDELTALEQAEPRT
jgi:hypothetical protein